jgi:hypothetical protein
VAKVSYSFFELRVPPSNNKQQTTNKQEKDNMSGEK